MTQKIKCQTPKTQEHPPRASTSICVSSEAGAGHAVPCSSGPSRYLKDESMGWGISHDNTFCPKCVFNQLLKETQNFQGKLLYVTDNGHFMSNGWAVAGLMTNNLVPVQKQNYLSSFFQHKICLGKKVSKGNACKKDEWWSPESCLAAHTPFLSPWSLWFIPRALKSFSSSWISPGLTLIFHLHSEWLRGSNSSKVAIRGFAPVGIL